MNIPKGSVLVLHELPLKEFHEPIRDIISKIKPSVVFGAHDHRLRVDKMIDGIRYVSAPMLGKVGIFEI